METREEATPRQKEVKKWAYEDYFREYLLLLASRGSKGLESINRFPERIELGKIWHKILDKMRQDSQDGIERLALIGFKGDKRRVFLPTMPVTGTSHTVPCDVISKTIATAKDKFAMQDFIGDIHSHPGDLFSRIFGYRVAQFLANLEGEQPGFSVDDLYRIVASSNASGFPGFFPVMGVVDANTNLFAFKTRETSHPGIPRNLFDKESFKKYWYEKYGFSYSVDVEGGRSAKPLTSRASHQAVIMGIAQRHQIALYKGKPGKDLVRTYP